MKKAFRWACVILSVVTLCAWAPLLLREAREPWSIVGVDETSNSGAETKPDEKQTDQKIALTAKADLATPGEGDKMRDPMAVQQERQQESPEINETAGMRFGGPGPMAAKSRHHRTKKSSESDADSSVEKAEKKDDVVLAAANNAEDSRLVQTLIPSNPLPSTPALALLPTVGLSAPSTVTNTTQTLVERITAPVGMTVNNLTEGITSASRTRLQSLVYTTQSTIPNTSTVGTIVGNTTTTLQAPVHTLTSQTLGTVSLVSSTVPSVTGGISSVSSGKVISGSPILPMVISPSSTASGAVSAPSTSSLVVSPMSTSSFAVSPTSVSSTAVSSSAVSGMAISPAVTTSVPTSLSSSSIGATIGPKNPLRPTLSGGH